MLIQQGHYDAALASFDQALKLQPHHPKLWVFHGVVLAHLCSYRSALASFNRALELAPENREAWIFRGAALTQMGRCQEAQASYSQALRIQRQGGAKCRSYPLWSPSQGA